MFLAFGVVCALLEAQRSRARARSSTPRWSTAPPMLMTMFHGILRHRACGTTSAAPTCSTPAPTSTTSYETRRRQVRLDRLDRAAVLRRAAAPHRASTDDAEFAKQMDRAAVAGAEGAARRGVPHEDPRRVVRAHGAHRRVLRAGADHGRGRRASAQRRPRDVRRGRRRHAARAGAALLAHRRPRSRARRPTPGSTPTRCWPTGASACGRGRRSCVESGAVR